MLALVAPLASGQELPNLPPLSPQDLQMKDSPAAPGVPAMILYYAVDTDNLKSTETHSFRIKVFGDEGKKYGDVTIPYYDKYTRVEEIHARTIGTDGKIAEFNEQVFDREIVKAKKLRVSAKVFTLPNVLPGSILEYSYRLHFHEKIPEGFQHPEKLFMLRRGFTYPAAAWEIQRNLFARHEHFALHYFKGGRINWHYLSLAKDPELRKTEDGFLQLDLDNIPAYEEEEYSPPEETEKSRLDLFYTAGFFSNDSYWIEAARSRAEALRPFLAKSKALEREVARVTDPGDSDLTKLQKIYARVQQIRAVSYEGAKSEKELKQENLKENKSADDILSHGYAFANETDLLFAAMLNAAGLRAYPMLVTSRTRSFFMKDYPNEEQLNAMVVAVGVGGNTMFLDPATRFCPFGLLPWEETSTGGIVIDETRPDVGKTPVSKSSDAVVKATAHLQLSQAGDLSGSVTMTYAGQEALSLRLEALRQDEVARSKALEQSLSERLTQSATVKLIRSDGWESTDAPLTAEFQIEVPEFATSAGSRLILPLNIFHARAKNPFATPQRKHPIYFGYAVESYEDTKIDLPAGVEVESVPDNRKSDQGAAFYELTVRKDGTAVQLNRTYRVGGYFFAAQQYPAMREFFTRVLAGDTQQVALRAAKTAGNK